MKQFLSAVAVCLLTASASMGQGIKTPAASPTQTIKQQFALSAVEVTYSRPLAKGRTIMGDLVPYDKLWRTGANNPTKITFGEDVKLNGQAVPAGSYALYTVPSKTGWEIIINDGLKNWGVDGYKKENDLVRFQTESQKLPFAVESFMIMFENVRPTAMTMMLAWEKTLVPIEITADIDGKVMAQIDSAMATEKKPYFSAASYYYDSGKDLKKALSWADAATKEAPKAFYIFHLKAKIQARLGDKAGAKATALQSIALAKEAKNDDYVALNEKLMANL
ncbi:DUF2911 domain-containing protein [Chitinophaga sp. SYP-B3965]|uniref:DUF2911 domain-containing protein n=1 Tax=Chitinophaga sp. SYP-B3965 TaxID=2663120 RepID=UPI001299539A|nr:DUF2911 domain-containing protein [Chitinophaga sp. SYP-B3965]MRG44530.1 DUF2911 domain-containing protein [Chitinophaga sp. SYP-B3965]